MTAARRWGPWVLLVAVAVAALVIGLGGTGSKPTLDAQVQHIGNEVRCPVCDGETVAQSQAAPSVQIMKEIRTDLQHGESQSRILSSIVAAYGPGILEKPPAGGVDLVVWVLPVVGLVVAAAGLLVMFRRWARSSVGAPAGPQDDEAAEAPEPAVAAKLHPTPAAPTPAADPGSAGRPSRPRRAKVVVACAGVLFVAGGASWAVAASAGTRLPGEEITGQVLGPEQVAADLQAATNDENKNDVVDAVKEYQKVLAAQPDQVQALTGEGWLLAETAQPSLLQQGLSLLVRAERSSASYAPAHLYRGLALLGEDDYSDSIPELQWYLAHNPDPQLAPQVRKALSDAESKQPAAGAKSS